MPSTAEHLQQFESEAVAKFEKLIPNLKDNIPVALDALAGLHAVRGLSPCEKRIIAGLIKLDAYRLAASHFVKPPNKD